MTNELESLTYPQTRREPASETLGGVAFADPYRWLEDDVAAQEWDQAQNSVTASFLEGWEHYDALRSRLAMPLLRFPGGTAAPSAFGPFRCGDRWLQFVLRGEDFPQLQISDQPLASGSVVFDPAGLPEGHPRWMKWVAGSPDGRLAAICFMRDVGGREPEVLRVLDIATGRLLSDKIEGIHYASLGGAKLAWLGNSSGFFYVGQDDAPGPPRWRPGYVAFHRLGDAGEHQPGLRLGNCIAGLQTSPDHRYVAAIEGFASPRATYIMDSESELEWRPFLPELAGRAYGVFAGDQYIAVVTDDAPKGRVVSVPVDSADDRSTWTEVIPEGDRVVWSVGAAADTLVVGLVDDSGQELRLFSRDGSPRGRLGLEPGAVASAESVLGRGITPCPGGFVFWHNTFTSLPAAYRYDLGDAALSTIVPAAMEPDLELRVLDCRSADGVGLRVRLMHRPGLDVSGPRPLLLSGYGNLNQVFVNPAEAYGAFLDAGGVFAWATIPGGGEFGSSWWRMANQENMGRRGRDLASVAEFLIENGHTTSAQLAIIGGSGGGVLTSMAITERPDLYRAAAILFPQTDFARYIHEPYGRAWVASEWGDPEDPELAPVIRKWSPYHNVKPGEHYPATLFFVGTEDGICPPWHSRKLAAALQSASASDAPILIRVIPRFGHAVGEPEAVAALAREPLAFVMRMLGMTPGVSMNEGERA